jgi:RNA polymerase sigma-70 factor (ECF subfamily)
MMTWTKLRAAAAIVAVVSIVSVTGIVSIRNALGQSPQTLVAPQGDERAAQADQKDENAPSLKTAPAVVIKPVPQAGALNVDPATTEIRVTYSKDMQNNSWSWSTWGEENYPKTTGKPHYMPDKRTCVLPVKLEPGRFYAIWLNSENFGNFKDTTGRSAVPYLLVFETKK